MDKWLIRPSQLNSEHEPKPSSSMVTQSTASSDSDLTDESDYRNPPCKKVRASNSRRRIYKFRQQWLENENFKNWLIRSSGKSKEHEHAACKLCHISIFPNKNDIIRHSKTGKHKALMRQISNTKPLTEIIINKPHTDNVKYAELKLTAMLASNNVPFLLMDTLVEVCSDVFSDSKIAKDLSLHRTKATAIMVESLGKHFKEEVYMYLRVPGNFFSLIMDETTDVGSVKQCAFSVIYFFSESNEIVTRFFDMVEVQSSTADDLYNALKFNIEMKKIPLTNLIGFASDTTNVMVGHYNSVFSHLKQDIPEIVCVRCSCHMIHLAASKSCLELPRHVEDVLMNIGSHFSRSFHRQTKFREFQTFFGTDLHKILQPSQTRWLSVEECASRVLEQYEHLKLYFRQVCFEDPSITNEQILDTLNNSFTKIYFEFMTYILHILNNFNTLFQSAEPLLHKLKPEIQKILKIIYSNYINNDAFKNQDIFKFDHKNPRNFLPVEKIYLGINAHESLAFLKQDKHVNAKDIDLFQTTCLKFYIRLATEIKERFHFEDTIFDLISIVDPVIAQKHTLTSLYQIFQRFSILKNYVDMQELDNEWKEHSLLNFDELGLNSNLSASQYWAKVFSLKNGVGTPLFLNLKKVICFLLILPFSNAAVERIFSDLKNIKTDTRNKLKTETVCALLATREGVKKQGGCINFKPSKEMMRANIWNKK